MNRRDYVIYFLLSVGWIGTGLLFATAGHPGTGTRVVALAGVAVGVACVVRSAVGAVAHLVRTTD